MAIASSWQPIRRAPPAQLPLAGASNWHAVATAHPLNRDPPAFPLPHLQHLRLLYRRIVRHGYIGVAAKGRCAHGQADARAAHGALSHQAASLQAPLCQRLLNDFKGHTVLHAAARVQELRFGQDLQGAVGMGRYVWLEQISFFGTRIRMAKAAV